jgi:TolB-like protein
MISARKNKPGNEFGAKTTLTFFQELKRRNVFRVGIAYVVTAWLLLQVADVVLNNFELPGWVFRTTLLVLAIGLPVALLLAWAFELTPEGIRKEKEVDRSQSMTAATGRRMDRHIIIALTLALGLFAVDKFVLDPARDREIAEAAAEQARNEAPAARAAENSIAVLPFTDMSASGDQQYFSDGIAEEILNALVRVDGLKVASRTSAFAFRGDEQNLRDIAEALEVSHILEGSVRRAGNQVRITAQLIDARSDRHLWSETFDRNLDDILAIQDEIANSIVSSMREELGLEITGQAAIASDTDNVDAYDLYLQGRALVIARGDIGKAAELLKRAVDIDPEFAKAWEVLGAAYFIGPSWGYDMGDEPYELALAASEQALELDDSLALPWSVIGSVGELAGKFGYATTMEYHQRAMDADPHNATVHLWAGLSQGELGFIDKSIPLLRRCLEIDPAYGNCKIHLASMYLSGGDEERAIQLIQESAEDGFTGNEAVFIPLILRHQGRAPAAYVAVRLTAGRNFPVRDLLDILQYPERDHSAAQQRYRARVDEFEWRNLISDPVISAYFNFFDRTAVAVDDSFNWMWGPDLKRFRQSPEFKLLLEDLGSHTYWRSHGFPPQCRALGEDDFECD